MSHKINPPISDFQKQIIYGTLLGGSSLIKYANGVNSYLSMRSKNIEWLTYKAKELESLASSTPFTKDTTGRWHSMCYPIFNTIRNDFYDSKGNRRLREDSLDSLKDIAFSIWYGDCGKHDKNGCISLNTHVWGEKNSKIIIKYLKVIEINSKIVFERNCLRILLDKSSSEVFFKLAEPQLPHWFLKK